MAFEAVGSFLNSYPIFWPVYGFVICIPLVAVVSYFFWPKDSKSGSSSSTKSPNSENVPSPTEERAKDDISGGDSGIEASGETERGLRASTSSCDERDRLSRTPDSLQGEEGIRTDSALGDPEDTSQKPSSSSDEISVVVTDVLDGRGVRFRGTNRAKGARRSASPPSLVEDEVSRSEQNETEEASEDAPSSSAPRWNFPPVLEDFDLMESDVDPSQLEDIFADDRLIEVLLQVEAGGPGVGISIVGGSGSPNGDLPILVKRVLPGSLAEQNGRLKAGDELIAVNDTLLVGVQKDFAINGLCKMVGDVRLLVLQDD